jgi:hypothetical protein
MPLKIPGTVQKSIAKPKKTRCPSCHKLVNQFHIVRKNKKVVRACPFCSFEFEMWRPRTANNPDELARGALEMLDKQLKKFNELNQRAAVLAIKAKEIKELTEHKYEAVYSDKNAPELEVKDITIVGMMLDKYSASDAKSYVCLLLSVVAYSIFVLLSKSTINYGVVLFVVVLAGILYTNRELLVYRIRKGYYGTTEEEARDIIEFILDHSDDTDFTDGSGIKKLMPDPEVELQEEFVPVGGLTT